MVVGRPQVSCLSQSILHDLPIREDQSPPMRRWVGPFQSPGPLRPPGRGTPGCLEQQDVLLRWWHSHVPQNFPACSTSSIVSDLWCNMGETGDIKKKIQKHKKNCLHVSFHLVLSVWESGEVRLKEMRKLRLREVKWLYSLQSPERAKAEWMPAWPNSPSRPSPFKLAPSPPKAAAELIEKRSKETLINSNI